MKPVRTLILIADGARARALLHTRPGNGLKALPEWIMSVDHKASRDIFADKPGRTFDSAGPGRHAMEPPTDPHDEMKREFARTLAHRLADEVDTFDRLILVAAPATLGEMRKALATSVEKKTMAEIAKDLTQVPNDEVASHLANVIPV